MTDMTNKEYIASVIISAVRTHGIMRFQGSMFRELDLEFAESELDDLVKAGKMRLRVDFYNKDGECVWGSEGDSPKEILERSPYVGVSIEEVDMVKSYIVLGDWAGKQEAISIATSLDERKRDLKYIVSVDLEKKEVQYFLNSGGLGSMALVELSDGKRQSAIVQKEQMFVVIFGGANLLVKNAWDEYIKYKAYMESSLREEG